MRDRFYPSDLTDEQWALIEPLLPPPHWDGRKEKWPRREIVDAIAYLNRTGCSWRQLPRDFLLGACRRRIDNPLSLDVAAGKRLARRHAAAGAGVMARSSNSFCMLIRRVS